MIGVTASDRGHRFRSGSPLTNYPHATPIGLSAPASSTDANSGKAYSELSQANAVNCRLLFTGFHFIQILLHLLMTDCKSSFFSSKKVLHAIPSSKLMKENNESMCKVT